MSLKIALFLAEISNIGQKIFSYYKIDMHMGGFPTLVAGF